MFGKGLNKNNKANPNINFTVCLDLKPSSAPPATNQSKLTRQLGRSKARLFFSVFSFFCFFFKVQLGFLLETLA